ncbi:Berberine and berberine like domain-containing protein [Phytophthora infestans]|uniref:Berberine and berberine like domain-containing protein n=1 Tax=Phytophthora infestans TaxID=4787 RepID=A0A8S9UVF3_PHYIN|nr:Berberine and berberine like domain-containing protein [Phytophthora infestans]
MSSPRLAVQPSLAACRSTPLDNASAWELFSGTAFAPKLPNALASGFVDIWGGGYAKTVKADASAWKHDDNLHLVRWGMRTATFDVKFADSSIATMRKGFYSFVDAYKASGGVPGGFTTYRDEKWTVPEMAEYLYGGGNFKKMQQIKTEVDPNEMFNTDPQAIPALAKTIVYID